MSSEPIHTPSSGKSIQQYIDEVPVWSDGTALKGTPMTAMQWRIWSLAVAGKFFEGLVIFMTGIALPLIVQDFSLQAAQKGVVTAVALFGILIGATMLGGLSDVFGRKRMFIVEMLIFVAFLIGLTLSPNYIWMVVCLFGIGLALGCDYPTAHLVISEAVPSKGRGGLVLGAFAFQAVGAIVGAGLGIIILDAYPEVDAWRWMYAAAIIPAILVIVGRFFITDSPHWLASKGRVEEAEKETRRLLKRVPQYPKEVRLNKEHAHGHQKVSPMVLFNTHNRRATILASIPWFIQDLGTYGIGIFTPIILASTLGSSKDVHSVADLAQNVMLSAKGTALLDVLLILGVLAAIFMVEGTGRIKLQIIGFIGCAVGLGLAAISLNLPAGDKTILLFAGFMLFNFMTNLGPNAQTYLLAGEVFPTSIRGYGAGFAASFAKIGAVMTAFLFPILLHTIGTQTLLIILVGTSILGAIVTWTFRVETRGSLEKIEKARIQPQV
ncbi:MFS transporter [Acidithiobacillus montserratensis]|uniref:MFS transporter n=1 Tax=Acidithiobacillus montserratensis TaxID=2729135 RepID=A0ACD5HFZ3_9PROT|nr:MFS transporter [Acidithiobacillus montserratensis]MBN2678850.1 MFS transporter [Acidithiobacillaceae bacterium]MBU2748031.1 MFS transporter [Acidithiobacillus montserratensis]